MTRNDKHRNHTGERKFANLTYLHDTKYAHIICIVRNLAHFSLTLNINFEDL